MQYFMVFSPPQMLGGYGEFMYQTGMIDELQRQYVVQQTDYGVKLIQQEKWVEAFQVRDVGCCLDLSKKCSIIYQRTHFSNRCHFHLYVRIMRF